MSPENALPISCSPPSLDLKVSELNVSPSVFPFNEKYPSQLHKNDDNSDPDPISSLSKKAPNYYEFLRKIHMLSALAMHYQLDEEISTKTFSPKHHIIPLRDVYRASDLGFCKDDIILKSAPIELGRLVSISRRNVFYKVAVVDWSCQANSISNNQCSSGHPKENAYERINNKYKKPLLCLALLRKNITSRAECKILRFILKSYSQWYKRAFLTKEKLMISGMEVNLLNLSLNEKVENLRSVDPFFPVIMTGKKYFTSNFKSVIRQVAKKKKTRQDTLGFEIDKSITNNNLTIANNDKDSLCTLALSNNNNDVSNNGDTWANIDKECVKQKNENELIDLQEEDILSMTEVKITNPINFYYYDEINDQIASENCEKVNNENGVKITQNNIIKKKDDKLCNKQLIVSPINVSNSDQKTTDKNKDRRKLTIANSFSNVFDSKILSLMDEEDRENIELAALFEAQIFHPHYELNNTTEFSLANTFQKPEEAFGETSPVTLKHTGAVNKVFELNKNAWENDQIGSLKLAFEQSETVSGASKFSCIRNDDFSLSTSRQESRGYLSKGTDAYLKGLNNAVKKDSTTNENCRNRSGCNDSTMSKGIDKLFSLLKKNAAIPLEKKITTTINNNSTQNNREKRNPLPIYVKDQKPLNNQKAHNDIIIKGKIKESELELRNCALLRVHQSIINLICSEVEQKNKSEISTQYIQDKSLSLLAYCNTIDVDIKELLETLCSNLKGIFWWKDIQKQAIIIDDVVFMMEKQEIVKKMKLALANYSERQSKC